MNSDSGFGSSGAPYEYAIAEAKSKARKKKTPMIVGYVIYGVVFMAIFAGINPWMMSLVAM